MEKIKYDSIYKFEVSLGLILIILPFIFIYYFYNSNDLLLIKEDEILKTTDIAQKIIEFKQSSILVLIEYKKIFFIVFGIIEVFGIFVLGRGIFLWNKNVQKFEDKRIELDCKIQEKNLEQLSSKEKEIKTTEEILAINDETIKDDEINKYIETERKFTSIIRDTFSENKVINDVKINDVSIDCLVEYNNPSNLLARAFEIVKNRNRKINIRYLDILKARIEKFAMAYYGHFSQYCLTCALIVVDNLDDKFILENKRIIDEIKIYNSTLHNNQICKIIVVDEKNVREKLNRIKENGQIEY